MNTLVPGVGKTKSVVLKKRRKFFMVIFLKNNARITKIDMYIGNSLLKIYILFWCRLIIINLTSATCTIFFTGNKII